MGKCQKRALSNTIRVSQHTNFLLVRIDVPSMGANSRKQFKMSEHKLPKWIWAFLPWRLSIQRVTEPSPSLPHSFSLSLSRDHHKYFLAIQRIFLESSRIICNHPSTPSDHPRACSIVHACVYGKNRRIQDGKHETLRSTVFHCLHSKWIINCWSIEDESLCGPRMCAIRAYVSVCVCVHVYCCVILSPYCMGCLPSDLCLCISLTEIKWAGTIEAQLCALNMLIRCGSGTSLLAWLFFIIGYDCDPFRLHGTASECVGALCARLSRSSACGRAHLFICIWPCVHVCVCLNNTRVTISASLVYVNIQIETLLCCAMMWFFASLVAARFQLPITSATALGKDLHNFASITI